MIRKAYDKKNVVNMIRKAYDKNGVDSTMTQ